MSDYNLNIKKALNDFITLDNPQYAIMIKGQWGCGKTYFIKDWISEIKKSSKGKKKPLYLSLYGMDNLLMVRDAMNKLLHPIINSKLVKGIGKFASCATKATIKTELPIGEDKHDVSYSLDFSSLLQTESKTNAGGKILIFDDLERCDVPLHVILGFINFFVEQCGCYVIVVCDDSKFIYKKEESQTKDIIGTIKFEDFKEKTIGREYLIQASIKDALLSFINESGADPNNLLNNKIDSIIEFLNLAKVENLRIVRQCILDFAKIVEQLDNYNQSKVYNSVMLQLIFNMLAVYAEQKAGNAIFASWDNLVNSFLPSEEERDEYHSLITKYSKVPEKLGIEILGPNEIKSILWYLKGGEYPIETIKKRLETKKVNQNPWDKLLTFWTLTNSDFNAYYDATCTSLRKGQYKYIEDLIKTMFVLINIENKNIRQMPEDMLEHAISNYEAMMKTAKDYETLHRFQSYTIGRFNYYRIETNTDKWHTFMKACKEIFKKLLTSHRSKATELLESLSNNNIEQLALLQNQPSPDNHSNYELAPMFHEVDVDLVAQNIDKLNNEAKMLFVDFLIVRYDIDKYGNKECSLNGRLEQDVENLSLILSILKELQKKKTLVDEYVGRLLIEKLEIVVKSRIKNL